tara:strand:+ start:23 stop:223 length:201 start_codon:yes stop_codon:yes gene_type:complete
MPVVVSDAMASVRVGFIRGAPLIDTGQHYLMDYGGTGFLKSSDSDSLSVRFKFVSLTQNPPCAQAT